MSSRTPWSHPGPLLSRYKTLYYCISILVRPTALSYCWCTVRWSIATRQQQWSFCPFSGGFDFRTYASDNKEVRRSRSFLPTSVVLVSWCKINNGASYRATAKHTHGLAIDVCLSVCPSACLSNACIVTKRKHLAKKVQLWLIGSRPWAFQWA